MAEQFRDRGVTADLAVRVPRDTAGDLESGVRSVLGRVEAVESVDSVTVTGIEPGLNDIRTNVRVRITVAPDRPGSGDLREALEGTVGVAVRGTATDRTPVDDQ